ncbi:GTP cyclohydrolase 1 type 2/Nif3 [Lipomyces japonicus]|uniref:GTP cyclohydrolase 1 type 2/Nif3 n=1 Tax=Lipomyces japonicus TaxID=56871 RepID=UPI0034CF7638
MSKAIVSSASTTKVLKNLISTVQQLYPPVLADKSWDNTGLLLESPVIPNDKRTAGVVLTIDLTSSVVDEVLKRNNNTLLIVSYHPIIFRPLKSLTLSNTQQRSLLRLVQAGISVYSPHTAVDAQVGGMNDWLAEVAVGINHPDLIQSNNVIEKNSEAEYTGFGRLVSIKGDGLNLKTIIENVKAGLKINHVQVALADRHKDVEHTLISSIAICAGSGSSILSQTEADVWFTGELSHHEVLAIKEKGITAIICGHTNTEREYLHSHFAPKFKAKIQENLAGKGGDYYDEFAIDVHVSEEDKDPITIF